MTRRRRWIPILLVPVIAGSSPSEAQAPSVPPPVRPSPNICLPGTGSFGWCGDGGLATQAKLARPNDVAIAPDGTAVIADTANQVIRAVDPSGRIATIAGTGARGGAPGAVSARRATFRNPAAVAVDADGSVIVADTENNSIRRIELAGRVVTIVGSGLASPRDVVVLPTGGYAVADYGNHRVVHVAADGTVTPIAGTGVRGYSGDGGPAVSALLDGPIALASSSSGLLIADNGNDTVRLVAPDGTISTRLALEAPVGVAATAAGFVVSNADRVSHAADDGTIQPFAGTGAAGYNGDDGVPVALRLDRPTQLAAAPDGTMLIVDRGNERIRRVAADGASSQTLAGSDDPNVRLAPTATAPFETRPRRPLSPCAHPLLPRPRVRRCVPRLQLRRSYPPPPSRPPECSVGSTTANKLKIQPYSATRIASAEKPVVIDFGISVDAKSLKAFAWRNDKRYGTRQRKQNASTGASIRLRGRLSKNTYYAVVEARTTGKERLCDARLMEVG